jgi:hypothetical protein
MAADPALLKRIRACPFARGGRVRVRYRANGTSLFARRSGEPLARLRLTGNGDDVVLLYPSHRGGWEPPGDFGALAMPLELALQRLSSNPYFPGAPADLWLSATVTGAELKRRSLRISYRCRKLDYKVQTSGACCSITEPNKLAQHVVRRSC